MCIMCIMFKCLYGSIWKWNFLLFWNIMTDRLTDRPGLREVSLPITIKEEVKAANGYLIKKTLWAVHIPSLSFLFVTFIQKIIAILLFCEFSCLSGVSRTLGSLNSCIQDPLSSTCKDQYGWGRLQKICTHQRGPDLLRFLLILYIYMYLFWFVTPADDLASLSVSTWFVQHLYISPVASLTDSLAMGTLGNVITFREVRKQ